MVEQPTNHSGIFFQNIKEKLPGGFDHRWNNPQQRSREMQRLVLGDARKVTIEEFEELASTVRDVREWLAENARKSSEYNEHWKDIPTFSLEDHEYYVRVILEPRLPSNVQNRKRFPKFILRLEEEDVLAIFNLYDNTYDLHVDVRGAPDLFIIDKLETAKMTKPEHDFVMGCIGRVASHFGIPLR